MKKQIGKLEISNKMVDLGPAISIIISNMHVLDLI